MGKVYEALERAEREESARNLSAVVFPQAVNSSTREGGEAAESFDFIDYSLNARPVSESAQRSHDEAMAAFSRRSLTEPGREVTIDAARLDSHLTTFIDANQVAAEQYNKLAISLISEKGEKALKKILIASTHRGEGRTCVALNLAGALARARQKVIVLDADLRRPSLLSCLGLDAEVGLANVIQQKLAPAQAIIKVQPFGFQILPTCKPCDSPSELFTSPQFAELLAMLEAQYDFVILDSSPLLQVNDANLLVRQTDAIVFVIRAGKTNSLQLSKAVSALTQDRLFGVVLNRTESWASA
jgi:capsular exopolysaccharide synthesis family protein